MRSRRYTGFLYSGDFFAFSRSVCLKKKATPLKTHIVHIPKWDFGENRLFTTLKPLLHLGLITMCTMPGMCTMYLKRGECFGGKHYRAHRLQNDHSKTLIYEKVVATEDSSTQRIFYSAPRITFDV